jgi:hypothetical protein
MKAPTLLRTAPRIDRLRVAIEQMFFDGALAPDAGSIRPDPSRPGLGLELKRADVERFAV